MYTMSKWKTENSIVQEQQYTKWNSWNIKQMQTEKQVRSYFAWPERAGQRFLIKIRRRPLNKITISKNLVGFSFAKVHKITEHTDFLWNHLVKTLSWLHIKRKITSYCKFCPFYSFGWRLLQCQWATLSSK